MPSLKGWTDNAAWSYKVHRRLGEELSYFFATIRPYEHDKVVDAFNKLIVRSGIGSLRVFPIFGQHDLLIRTWLHRNTADRFPNLVQRELGPQARLYPFTTTDFVYRWAHVDEDESAAALAIRHLTEKAIEDVQENRNPSLFETLDDNGLIVDLAFPDGLDRITFFVAITLEQGSAHHHGYAIVARKLRGKIASHEKIKRFTLDIGSGFCSMMCKGHVLPEDYFEISRFVQWIGAELGDLGVSTETYLVHDRKYSVGNEKIGWDTFAKLGKRDLSVYNIVPELWDELDSNFLDAREEIVTVLSPLLKSAELSDEEVDLLHEYLLSAVIENPQQRAESLAGYFVGIEYFLRSHWQEMSGRLGLQPTDVASKAGVDLSSGKNISLGELFDIYRTIFNRMKVDVQLDERILGSWESLVKVRNQALHGGVEFMNDWQYAVEILIPEFPRVRALKKAVEEFCGGSERV